MRGTLAIACERAIISRFIPAYAGNTTRAHFSALCRSVHPRVCGEHELLDVMRVAEAGSSPRMRGTRSVDAAKVALDRFIPAYAGNTNLVLEFIVRIAVHPRVCGEHLPRAARGAG